MTKGHRITLTYNLYVSERLGGAIRPFSSADPTRYPAYEKAKALFEDPSFMKEGESRNMNSFWVTAVWMLIFHQRGDFGLLLCTPLCPHDESAEPKTSVCSQRL